MSIYPLSNFENREGNLPQDAAIGPLLALSYFIGIALAQQVRGQDTSQSFCQGVVFRLVDLFKVLAHDRWQPDLD